MEQPTHPLILAGAIGPQMFGIDADGQWWSAAGPARGAPDSAQMLRASWRPSSEGQYHQCAEQWHAAHLAQYRGLGASNV